MDQKEILLVEDNENDIILTIRALAKAKIINKLVVVRDGAEALDYLMGTGCWAGRDLSSMPQVILLDLKLPRVDGLEVLRRIRASERTGLLPVIVLTSSKEEKDMVASYRQAPTATFVSRSASASLLKRCARSACTGSASTNRRR